MTAAFGSVWLPPCAVFIQVFLPGDGEDTGGVDAMLEAKPEPQTVIAGGVGIDDDAPLRQFALELICFVDELELVTIAGGFHKMR